MTLNPPEHHDSCAVDCHYTVMLLVLHEVTVLEKHSDLLFLKWYSALHHIESILTSCQTIVFILQIKFNK